MFKSRLKEPDVKDFMQLVEEGKFTEASNLVRKIPGGLTSIINYSDPLYHVPTIFTVLDSYTKFLDSNGLKLAETMLTKGANPNQKTGNGLSCLNLGMTNPAVMRLILKYGYNVTIEDANPIRWEYCKKDSEDSSFFLSYQQLLDALKKNNIEISQDYIDFLEDPAEPGEIKEEDTESLKEITAAPDVSSNTMLTIAHCSLLHDHAAEVSKLVCDHEASWAGGFTQYAYKKLDYVTAKITYPDVPFLGIADHGE